MMISSPAARAEAIKQRALAEGFDACHIAEAGNCDPADALGAWLKSGYHADMDWMARTKALRQDVRQKLPGAASVIVLVKNYYREAPAPPKQGRLWGRVARYAWGRDYHRAMKKPLRRLARFADSLEEGAESYCSIDSGPVMERAWGAKAGAGWVGKNSLLLRRDIGSWFFLATVISTVRLAPDNSVADACGSCTACIDACPTDAIVEPYVVDSTRCISYQTIENRAEIPARIQDNMGDWVFGCDICQEVCPWNRFARETNEEDFAPRTHAPAVDLLALLRMPREKLLELTEGTPLRRAKAEGLWRNSRIALTNLRRKAKARGATVPAEGAAAKTGSRSTDQ